MKTIFLELKSQFRGYPKRMLFGLVGMPVVTFFEMILVATIYLILEPERLVLMEQSLSQKLAPLLRGGTLELTQVSLIGFALGILMVYVTLRTLYLKNRVWLEHYIFVQYGRKMLRAYMNATVEMVARVNQEKIILSVMQDSRFIGTACYAMLGFSGTLIALLLYVCMGAALSIQMLLLGGSIYLISFGVSRWGYNRMEHIGARKVKLQRRLLKFLKEFAQGHKRIVLDGAEQDMLNQSDRTVEQCNLWRVDKGSTQAWIEALTEGVAMLGLILIIFAGICWIDIPLAKLLILFVIFNRIKTYTFFMSRSYIEMKIKIPNFQNYKKIIGQLGDPDAIPFHEDHKNLDFRCIKLEQVSFGYEDKPVLDDVSVTFTAGDRVMIQGPSGGGKSTLLDLISGVLRPKQGALFIDECLFDLGLFYEIRHQIAYVSSRLFLFQDSIRKNLTLGKEVNNRELDLAIHQAGLEEVLSTLSKGLDTPIGMDGSELSVGQRARVIIARLFLQKPKLIILDEATTNLDEVLESGILNNLLSFIPSSSIFILVSHQIPKGVTFNKHFEIRNGKILPFAEA